MRGDSGPQDPGRKEAEFDELLREVLGRVEGALDERARWELLLDAVVAMGADLSLDGLLERIVSVATIHPQRPATVGTVRLCKQRWDVARDVSHGSTE